MKNVEQHIKQELEDRRIQPSSNAWKAIIDEVKQEEPSKKKKRFIPYLAVASLVLMGAIITFSLLKKQGEVQPSNKSIEEAYTTTEPTTDSNNNETPEVKYTSESSANNQDNKVEILVTETKANKRPSKPIEKPVYIESVDNEPIQNASLAVEKTPVLEIDTFDKIQKIEVIKTQLPKKQLLAKNEKNTETKKRIKINREKLLFHLENEDLKKKQSKIAFNGNTLSIDLNE